MQLKLKLIGRITQYKLVEIKGKRPFLDLHIEVVIKTALGNEYIHWLRCKVWYELALETAPLLSTGCKVAVTGRPEVHPYSRRDGTPAAELIVHADEIEVLAEADAA